MAQQRTTRLIAGGVLAAILLVVIALVLGGGNQGSGESAGSASSGVTSTATGGSGSLSRAAPVPSAMAAPPTSGAAQSSPQVESAVDTVTATRVVKTGSLSLRVARGQVLNTVSKLVTLTTAMGGYVSQSRTNSFGGAPTGELTLRVPVNQFDQAVTAAGRLGHVVSLTTNAQDVTGKVVDLGARVAALEQTRATYLTILGRARTIGATLEVQQRVEEVQQQIEEIQGELKVLRNQSSDGTLTVDVSQVGAVVTPVHHRQGGIGKAWTTSISRFNRGFDAIVGALGPLLLAILVLALLGGIGWIGYRGARRATTPRPPTPPVEAT